MTERNQRMAVISQSRVQTSASGSEQTMSADVVKAYREMDLQARDWLADAWLNCLSSHKHPKLVLFLDTYEQFQDTAEKADRDWLWATLARAHALLPGLRVVVGSRELVKGPERGLLSEPVKAFSQTHSDALLISLGVTDPNFRAAVYHKLAEGHPLVTRLAAEAWLVASAHGDGLKSQDVPDVADLDEALQWVHGKIVDRLDEPLKSAVRWGALLRSFNAEVLNIILEVTLTDDQFTQLAGYAFIIKVREHLGWTCHSQVRRAQSGYLRQERPAEFSDFHRRAAGYFQGKDPLEWLYHLLCVDEERDSAFQQWQQAEETAAFRYVHDVWERLLEVAESPKSGFPHHKERSTTTAGTALLLPG
jgi:hypothetical protein